MLHFTKLVNGSNPSNMEKTYTDNIYLLFDSLRKSVSLLIRFKTKYSIKY